MTTQQLYQKTLNEQMTPSDFLWSVRRDPQYYNIINGLMSFDDTVKVLKGKGHIWQSNQESAVKPYDILGSFKSLNEAAKSKKEAKVTADMVNYYEFTKGWKKELEKTDDLDKAKEKAIANIVKDPNYYTRCEMEAYQKSKNKKEVKNLPIDISKKNANYKDDANQMQKLDKAKPKSNVEDGLAKKERAKSKSAGLKSMKGGYPQMKKINEADETNADNKESYFLVKRDGTQSKTQLSDAEVAKFKETIKKNIEAQKDYDEELADHRAEIARGEYKMENPVPARSGFVEIIKASDAEQKFKDRGLPTKSSTEINRLKQQELKDKEKEAKKAKKAAETEKQIQKLKQGTPVTVFSVDKDDTGKGKIIPKDQLETIDGKTYPKTGGKWIPMSLTQKEIEDREENAKQRQTDYKQGEQGFYNVVKVKKQDQGPKTSGTVSTPKLEPKVAPAPSYSANYEPKPTKTFTTSKNAPASFYAINKKIEDVQEFTTKEAAVRYSNNNQGYTVVTPDPEMIEKKQTIKSKSDWEKYLLSKTDIGYEAPSYEKKVSKNPEKAKYFSVNNKTGEYKAFEKEEDVQGYTREKNKKENSTDYKSVARKGFLEWLKRRKKLKNKPETEELDDPFGLYTKNELELLKQSPKSVDISKANHFAVNMKTNEYKGFSDIEDANKYVKTKNTETNSNDFVTMRKKEFTDWNQMEKNIKTPTKDLRKRKLTVEPQKVDKNPIKEDNLLESIIRKKIKSLLKEHEQGQYVGVEGPDVKKKGFMNL